MNAALGFIDILYIIYYDTMILEKIVVLAACVLIGVSAYAETFHAKVIAISDGDTLTVLDGNNTPHKIRLPGIDAPEKSQVFRHQLVPSGVVYDPHAPVGVLPPL